MKIEARSLEFSYSGTPVLRGIDFTSSPGELTVILGANGGGKSTLLRLFAGYLRPTAGTLLVDGAAPWRLPPRRRAAAAAVISQLRPVGNPFTVFETVAMGAYHRIPLNGRMPPEEIAAVEEALEVFGLGGLAGRRCAELSGGEMQLAAAARARVQAAPGSILLADEPASMLDPARQRMLAGILKQWKSTLSALVMTTHDPAFAARYADRAVLLAEGTIIADGRPDQVLTAENLRRTYGCEPEFARDASDHLIPIF